MHKIYNSIFILCQLYAKFNRYSLTKLLIFFALQLGKMINDDSVFLDIPRFFIDMDKEVLAEEDVFDVITGNLPN